jgi:hypothetical protein
MSRNRENYSINQRLLFDENYNLAYTQSLKNKDIPEGGAKGTILPSYVVVFFFFLLLLTRFFLGSVQTLVAASRNTSMYVHIIIVVLTHIFTELAYVRPSSTSSSLDKHPELRKHWLICSASLSCCSSVLMVRGDSSQIFLLVLTDGL